MISIAISTMLTACRKAVMSNSPSGRRNFIRFSDARLQAESSRNMYSEHGFEALIGPVFLQVCQSLTVVSNCRPGSPQTCAASTICRIMSRARRVSTGCPSLTARVVQRPSSRTAFIKASVARTELLLFWKNTDP